MNRLFQRFVLLAVVVFFAFPAAVAAQTQEPTTQQIFYRATVIQAGNLEQREQTQIQHIKVRLENGDAQGTEIELDNSITAESEKWREVHEGDKIVILKTEGAQGAIYFMTDRYRLPSILLVLAVFLLLAIVFAGKKGLFAIGGMFFSILILTSFIVPQIAQGHSPLLIGGAGALLIGVVSLYVAHGFQKRTTVALIGTLITIVLAAILSTIAVHFAKIYGGGSEEAYFLQFSFGSNIELQGLFLVGVIIGTLGVLDDITTSLSATVEELHLANPNLPHDELYKRGLRVGVEHIASLINTLVLAYAGASLPLLLLFTLDLQPFWVTVNSQFMAEEIIRTVVGSTALILAVPITTTVAAYTFTKKKY